MEKEQFKNIKAGNPEAFRKLYDEYAASAIRTAIAITRNNELAKDAVQETFIRVYRHISKFDHSKPFEPWFYRILTNECNRLLKSESKSSHLNLENEYFIEEPTRELSDIYEVIQSFRDMYRIPLILKYLKNFTEKEIADILDINVNTVKSRLLKGRNMLRKQVKLSLEEG